MHHVGYADSVVSAFNSQGELWYSSSYAAQCQNGIEQSIRQVPQYKYSSLNGDSKNIIAVHLAAEVFFDALNKEIKINVTECPELEYNFSGDLSRLIQEGKNIDTVLKGITDLCINRTAEELPSISRKTRFTATSFAVVQLYQYDVKYGKLHAHVNKVMIIPNPILDTRINNLLVAAVAKINEEQKQANQGLSWFVRRWNPYA